MGRGRENGRRASRDFDRGETDRNTRRNFDRNIDRYDDRMSYDGGQYGRNGRYSDDFDDDMYDDDFCDLIDLTKDNKIKLKYLFPTIGYNKYDMDKIMEIIDDQFEKDIVTILSNHLDIIASIYNIFWQLK